MFKFSAPVILGICGIFASTSSAQPDVLNPQKYTSPSGEYKLSVDPSVMYGQSGGTYRFTRNGKEVWSGKRALTLWDCVVTDDGLVAGFAYSRGRSGISIFKPDEKDCGYFHVIIFEPDGKLRLNEITKRHFEEIPDAPPIPVARGIFVDSKSDRLVIRIRDTFGMDAADIWWTYRLSSGNRLPDIRPMRPREAKTIDVTKACAIPGTPLTLLQWQTPLHNGAAYGIFSLVDASGNTVWTLVLPDDYTASLEPTAHPSRGSFAFEDNGILSVGEGPTFDLHFVRGMRRVTFVVEPNSKNEKGWDVLEVKRTAFVGVSSEEPPFEIPTIKLRHIGAFNLTNEPQPDEESLDGIAAITLGPTGSVYAVSVLGNIYVFEQDGRLIRVSEFQLTDHPTLLWMTCLPHEITITNNGNAYVAWGKTYLQFDTDGNYIGEKSPDFCSIAGNSKYWVQFPHHVSLLNGEGQVRCTINRRLDGDWLEKVDGIGVAPNGAAAIAASQRKSPGYSDSTLNLYTPNGDPVQMIAIPEVNSACRLANNGQFVALSVPSKLLLINTDTPNLVRLESLPGNAKDELWEPFFSPNGKELWLFRWGGHAIERYELPETPVNQTQGNTQSHQADRRS